MKYTALRAFEKHLESAAPNRYSDIYFIIGKEGFERKVAADMVVSHILKEQKNPSLGLLTFESDRLSTEELMNELNTLPFFSEKRVVLIQDAEKLNKETTSQLELYFQKPNPTICLIISASAIHQGTNFYKKGEKAGIVLDYVEQKPWEKEQSIIPWIESTVACEGKKIDANTSRFLIKLLGTQQSTLHSELQKLICYVGSRPEITMQDISKLTSGVNVETIWQLGEAIFRKDSAASLRICKALLQEGSPFLSLLRQIRTQFQTEFQVCSILSNGGTSAEVAKQFPYMKGFILDRHVQMAQSYGMQRFKSGMLHIDATEVQAKNSGTDDALLAELLIIKLTM